MSIPKCEEVRKVGVDDWAFRKGVTYGSIIVSLDTSKVIDLLGDRNSDSFRTWLDNHTGVSVVSRDRSTDYTAAIASTGRAIIEVADRFHLIKNMSDCVTKVISSHYEDYRKSVRPNDTCAEARRTDSRQVMFDEVKELQAKGYNIKQISEKLGIARQTVRKYMKWERLQERAIKERYPYYLYDTDVEEEYKHGRDLKKIFNDLIQCSIYFL